MLRAALYTRVSSNEQAQGYSLDNQLTACRQLAALRSWEIVGEWSDTMSGRRPDRPEYQAMLAKFVDYDAVVVWRFDRLGRDEPEFFTTLANLKRAGKEVVSVTEPNGSPVVTGILAVLAAEESRRIAARVRPGQQARAQAGKWLGVIAWGMRYGADGRPELDPDPSCQAVDLAYQWYDPEGDCSTLQQIALRLHALGYRNRSRTVWRTGTLHYMLRNPQYAGHLRWGDTLVRNNHTPRIDPTLWERVQTRLGSHPWSHIDWRENPEVIARGLVYCECGKRMTVVRAREPDTGKVYTYYRCLCHVERGVSQAFTINVRMQVLRRWLVMQIAALQLTSQPLERVKLELERRFGTNSDADKLTCADSLLAGLRQKHRNLLEDRLARLVTTDEFTALVGPLRQQIQQAEVECNRLRVAGHLTVQAMLDNARRLLAGGELDNVLPLIVDRIVVHRGPAFDLVLSPGYDLFLSLDGV